MAIQPSQAREPQEFVEAIARGFAVIVAFREQAPVLSVSDVAARTGFTRPSVRRVLMTLEQLGYARRIAGGYELTAQTLELGASCVGALDIWDLARPHLSRLVADTAESSSLGELDGCDVVHMARVAVPKIVAVAMKVGTRLPAVATAMGHVLLAELDKRELAKVLREPSRSRVLPRVVPPAKELAEALTATREHGWAVSDQLLSVGVRSLAAPVRDATGTVAAALGLTVHASETSLEVLLGDHLPRLVDTAQAISDEWGNLALLPVRELTVDRPTVRRRESTRSPS